MEFVVEDKNSLAKKSFPMITQVFCGVDKPKLNLNMIRLLVSFDELHTIGLVDIGVVIPINISCELQSPPWSISLFNISDKKNELTGVFSFMGVKLRELDAWPLVVDRSQYVKLFSTLSILRRSPVSFVRHQTIDTNCRASDYRSQSATCIESESIFDLIQSRMSTRMFDSRLPKEQSIDNIIEYAFGPINSSKTRKPFLASAGGLLSTSAEVIKIDGGDGNVNWYKIDRAAKNILNISQSREVEGLTKFLLKALNENEGSHLFGYLFVFTLDSNVILNKYGFTGCDLSLIETGMGLQTVSLLSEAESLGSVILTGVSEFLNSRRIDESIFYASAIFVGEPRT